MALRIGDELPDLPLLTATGEQMSVRGLKGEATALIFLRHVG